MGYFDLLQDWHDRIQRWNTNARHEGWHHHLPSLVLAVHSARKDIYGFFLSLLQRGAPHRPTAGTLFTGRDYDAMHQQNLPRPLPGAARATISVSADDDDDHKINGIVAFSAPPSVAACALAGCHEHHLSRLRSTASMNECLSSSSSSSSEWSRWAAGNTETVTTSSALSSSLSLGTNGNDRGEVENKDGADDDSPSTTKDDTAHATDAGSVADGVRDQGSAVARCPATNLFTCDNGYLPVPTFNDYDEAFYASTSAAQRISTARTAKHLYRWSSTAKVIRTLFSFSYLLEEMGTKRQISRPIVNIHLCRAASTIKLRHIKLRATGQLTASSLKALPRLRGFQLVPLASAAGE